MLVKGLWWEMMRDTGKWWAEYYRQSLQDQPELAGRRDNMNKRSSKSNGNRNPARHGTATATPGGEGATAPGTDSRQGRSPYRAKLVDLATRRGSLAAAKVQYEGALKRFKSTSPMDESHGRLTDELQLATEAYVRAGEALARCCENV